MLPGLVPSAAAIIGLFWRLALTLQEIFLERTQTGTRHIYQVLNALWETVKPNMCVCVVWCTGHRYKVSVVQSREDKNTCVRSGVRCAPSSSSVYTKQSTSSPLSSRYSSV